LFEILSDSTVFYTEAMPQKRWVFDPDSGGIKNLEHKKREITARLQRFAAENYAGQYTRLDVRFRGQFCYIDAYTEPDVSEGWPPEDWPESREEMIDRLRNIPIHLCRLRYFGEDDWGFAFCAYSCEKYELAVFPNGSFHGHPEEALAVSAIYLR
jgi:hypothetical protein